MSAPRTMPSLKTMPTMVVPVLVAFGTWIPLRANASFLNSEETHSGVRKVQLHIRSYRFRTFCTGRSPSYNILFGGGTVSSSFSSIVFVLYFVLTGVALFILKVLFDIKQHIRLTLTHFIPVDHRDHVIVKFEPASCTTSLSYIRYIVPTLKSTNVHNDSK